jgi:hypothetical protein
VDLVTNLGGDRNALALVKPLAKPGLLGAIGSAVRNNALQTISETNPESNLDPPAPAALVQSPDAPQISIGGTTDSGGSIGGAEPGGDGGSGSSGDGGTGEGGDAGAGGSGDGGGPGGSAGDGPGGAAGDP